MSVNVRANLLGLLMAMCLASGVSALEVGQTPAPASDTPSFGLPAFLDGARLPDLQEAWRAHESEPQGTPAAEPAVTPTTTPTPTPTPEAVSHEEPAASPDPASDAAIESARAAITRAEQATDKAANVRTRAEELSRRFGAGDAAASPAAAEPTSAVDDGITTGATPAPGDGAETAATGEAPVDQPATAVETTAKAAEPASDGAASDEKSKASPRRVMGAGPSPTAALPAAAAAERKPATPPARSAGIEPSIEPKPASGSEPMPLEMRSFGWNSQP